ncbi:MAG: HAD family hydrolase [Candidatus Nanoarchaeia archaeon]|nr:HAD family hydrolase [Candidatus Nanoarchaeia archaeon]
MTKAIIFDLDGTLVDSLKRVYSFMRELCKRHNKYYGVNGQEIESPELLKKYWQEPFYKTFELFGFTWKKDKEKIQLAYNEYMAKNLPELYNGMYRLLKRLKEIDSTIGIVTSSLKPTVEATLKKNNLTSIIDHVVCDDGTKLEPKPSPDYLKRFLKETKIKPERAVYIGDLHSDIQAAKAAGMHSIGVSWGFGHHHAILKEQPTDAAVTIRSLESIIYKILRQIS